MQFHIIRKRTEKNHGGMRMGILEARHKHIASQINLALKDFIRWTGLADIDDAVPLNPYFFICEMNIRGKTQYFPVVKTNHINLLL